LLGHEAYNVEDGLLVFFPGGGVWVEALGDEKGLPFWREALGGVRRGEKEGEATVDRGGETLRRAAKKKLTVKPVSALKSTCTSCFTATGPVTTTLSQSISIPFLDFNTKPEIPNSD
jgi:hypothetical protein